MSRILVAASSRSRHSAGPSCRSGGARLALLPPGQTNDPFPQPIAARRGRDHGDAARVRVAARHRRRRGAHDDARPGTGHAAPVRQRHARPVVHRQPRWQDGDAVSRLSDPKWGVRCSRRAASAGCRASCCIRSSPRPARRDSASSTPTPIPRIRRPRRTSRRPTQQHARHGAARVDRQDAGRGGLRWRRAARADPAASAVPEPQRRHDHVQFRRRVRAPPTSDSSTWASATAAAAATR